MSIAVLLAAGVNYSCIVPANTTEGGMYWCLKSVGATAKKSGQTIYIKTEGGDWTSGCWCMCLIDHWTVVEGPGTEVYDYWTDSLRDDAVESCQARAYGPGGLACDPGSDNCVAKAALAEPYEAKGEQVWSEDITCYREIDSACYFVDIEGTTGTVEVTSTGAPLDPTAGPVVYGISSWSSVVQCSGTLCNVDREFLENVLFDDPWRLAQDNQLVTSGVSALGHAGWKYTNVGTTSLAYALGLRANDYVWEINGKSLATLADLTAAQELFESYPWTVKLDRGSTTITRTYARVNLSSYP